MAQKHYEEMSVDELNDLIQLINNQRDEQRDELLEIRQIRDRKAVQAAARAKLDVLSDAEKAALLQEVQATGIASGQQINNA